MHPQPATYKVGNNTKQLKVINGKIVVTTFTPPQPTKPIEKHKAPTIPKQIIIPKPKPPPVFDYTRKKLKKRGEFGMRRTKIEMCIAILKSLTNNPDKISHITVTININYSVLKRILAALIAKGLIVKNGKLYVATEKGKKLAVDYLNIESILGVTAETT